MTNQETGEFRVSPGSESRKHILAARCFYFRMLWCLGTLGTKLSFSKYELREPRTTPGVLTTKMNSDFFLRNLPFFWKLELFLRNTILKFLSLNFFSGFWLNWQSCLFSQISQIFSDFWLFSHNFEISQNFDIFSDFHVKIQRFFFSEFWLFLDKFWLKCTTLLLNVQYIYFLYSFGLIAAVNILFFHQMAFLSNWWLK